MSTPPFARPEMATPRKLTVTDSDRYHPFDVSQLPEILRSRVYFVENFKERAFLRILSNPFFVREVNFADVDVEVPEDARGTTSVNIKLMWVQFTPNPMTVGYLFRNEIRWFVPFINTGSSIGDLVEESQIFYDSVDWEQLEGIERAAEMGKAWSSLGR